MSVGTFLFYRVEYVGRVMAKVTKTIRLPVDVAERLEEEPNQSAAAEAALRAYFGMGDG